MATRNDLTTQDLKNIQACLSMADVKGVNAAAALLVLHNKVAEIIQSDEAANGNGNGTKSDKSGADQSAPADDRK